MTTAKLQSLIGKTESAVKELGKAENFAVRVRILDGQSLAGTQDMHANRANLQVDNGIVTNAWSG